MLNMDIIVLLIVVALIFQRLWRVLGTRPEEGAKPVKLSREGAEKLYNLLEYLMMNKGVLLFKEQIFDNICGYNSDASTEIIEVYMSRLRKNLSKYGYDKYIVTKRGMGYLMDESIED